MNPLLITFSGLDGAGKTTQIRMLQSRLEDQGHLFETMTMYDDISLAARFRKRWKPDGSRGDQEKKGTRPQQADRQFRLDKNKDEVTTVALRAIIYLFDLLYFSTVARFRWTKNLEVLVMDRYFYDSLANLVSARSFTSVYVWAFKRILPKPDLAVLLLVAPEIAFERKPEYPLEYLQRRELAYRKVFQGVPNSLLIDGAEDQRRIHGYIAGELNRLMNQRSNTHDA